MITVRQFPQTHPDVFRERDHTLQIGVGQDDDKLFTTDTGHEVGATPDVLLQ